LFVQLGDKRWKVDVGGRQHALLLLSSVNLPGGIQRRRTQEDSLNMRAFFSENDVISVRARRRDWLLRAPHPAATARSSADVKVVLRDVAVGLRLLCVLMCSAG